MENILNTIMYSVITVILPLLTTYIIMLLKKKINEFEQDIESERVRDLIDAAMNSVMQTVLTIEQTYVDTLKNKGEFTKDAQIEAKTRALEITKSLITSDGKKAIETLYGDFEVWLSTQIEMTVREIK